MRYINNIIKLDNTRVIEMFKRNAVNICFFIISLIVFAYFFRVMNWLDEQFSVWSSYYEIFLSGALPLKMSPYASTLVPVSIAYFTVAIFYFIRYYKNPFFITKLNYLLTILNIIHALFSCLAYFELISEMTAITIMTRNRICRQLEHQVQYRK